jgi:hypothetical protein
MHSEQAETQSQTQAAAVEEQADLQQTSAAMAAQELLSFDTQSNKGEI